MDLSPIINVCDVKKVEIRSFVSLGDFSASPYV